MRHPFFFETSEEYKEEEQLDQGSEGNDNYMMSSFETHCFLRGVSDKYNLERPTIHETRKNRRPKDSPQRFHQIADEWFTERFGIPFRSQALLLTSRAFTAKNYGATPAHVILPLSAYAFCWSSKVVDLLFAANQMENSPLDEIKSYLDSMQYRMEGLAEAHESGNEVMLYCDRYVAIPFHMVNERRVESDEPLILLGKV
jgi:hypothetical protein